jgi:alpha-tubulin suppressor-like RCC1 family protein
VTVSTKGADLDPDGYTIALDSALASDQAQSVAVNGTVTFSQLSPGTHALALRGATTNCPVVGDNPRAVSVSAGGTAQITFQIVCVQRVDLSGVWNYTEHIGSALACNDTGSYVFTPSGDGLVGTNDQVGTCDRQAGSIDNSYSGPVADVAVVYAVSGAVSITLSAGACSYAAEFARPPAVPLPPGSPVPPDSLINGTVNCSSDAGVWTAVRGGGPITSVTVSTPTSSLVAGGTAQLRAVLVDASGSRRVGPAVTWTSDAVAVATVDGSGVVAGVAPGTATITATAETKSGSATVGVEVVSFASVQAGAYHSCGLTVGGAAYCWGNGTYGQLGSGAKARRLAPAAVAGGLNLAAISVGAVHTCGLTASGAAYCWGSDYYGELGAGAPGAGLCGSEAAECSTTPLAVAGGHSFSSLSAGWEQSCALTATGAAYCWGTNTYGGLGDGSATNSRTPVQVTGALTFTSIGTGNVFACGLTPAGDAYCWGNNTYGQLGIGSTSPDVCNSEACSKTPVAVSGGLTFVALSVGYWHACGLTSGGAAYCWGDNADGQLGAATTEKCAGLGTVLSCSMVPLLVDGGLTFATLSAGSFHSCGVTTGDAGYCWGFNADGQLGNGTTTTTATPTAIGGGLTFAAVSASGRWHSCGLSAAGIVYCWGYNGLGQLGTGATSSAYVPVPVVGQAATSGTAQAEQVQVHRRVARIASASASARVPSGLSSGPRP